MSRSVYQTHRGAAHTSTQESGEKLFSLRFLELKRSQGPKVNPIAHRLYPHRKQTCVGRAHSIESRPLGAVHSPTAVGGSPEYRCRGARVRSSAVRLDSSGTKLPSDPLAPGFRDYHTEGLVSALPSNGSRRKQLCSRLRQLPTKRSG